MIPILACVQKYHWGRIGSSSLVGRYAQKTEEENKVEFENTHYAELWMGTHPKSPSMVKIDEGIQEFISKEFYDEFRDKLVELDLIIESHKDKFFNSNLDNVAGSGSLPFLFKILSVDTSLSIQAHPHKELAEKLNEQFPDIYKDANHKPEMIIAVTEFEAL